MFNVLFSLGISSFKKKFFFFFPGKIPKFVSGLTHLTLASSEEVNTCSVSNPLDNQQPNKGAVRSNSSVSSPLK